MLQRHLTDIEYTQIKNRNKKLLNSHIVTDH